MCNNRWCFCKMLIHMVELCIRNECVEIGKDIFEKALEIRNEMIKRGDLRTRWWIRLMGALFTPVSNRSSVQFSFVDTGGTSRTQNAKFSASDIVSFNNTVTCSNRFWISVGSGVTTPSIDDYRLVSKIAEALASHSVDETSGVITLSAGFTFANDTVINEVGLEYECTVASGSTCGRILVDRTLLSQPFTAPANTPITVTYRILV